jgi:hypothetical protein
MVSQQPSTLGAVKVGEAAREAGRLDGEHGDGRADGAEFRFAATLNVASIRNCRVSDIDRLFKTELRSPITLA